jgi:hypothetical protein
MAKKTITTKRGRDARTGQFVTEKYANSHPNVTVIETIKLPVPKKKK